MPALVVDASVLVVALGDDEGRGAEVRRRLQGTTLHAPALIDLEVTSALRGLATGQVLTASRATAALRDLADLPVHRAPHLPLLSRCWELRDNLTTYDAAYGALAELLDLPLLTADARIARASGPRCRIEVVQTGGS